MIFNKNIQCNIKRESADKRIDGLVFYKELQSGEIGSGTVGLGKEGFAQVSQRAGFVVAVGVGTVLQGAGDRSAACIELCRYHSAELGGQKPVKGESVEATLGIIELRFCEDHSFLCSVNAGET